MRHLNGDRVNGASATNANGTLAVGGPAARAAATTSRIPFRAGIPSLRDTVFRRLLAIADLAAAAGGLSIIGGRRLHR